MITRAAFDALLSDLLERSCADAEARVSAGQQQLVQRQAQKAKAAKLQGSGGGAAAELGVDESEA